jgi:L-lactate dehydrogenase complex protein LldG
VSGARERVLARIDSALATVPVEERPEDVAVARTYEVAGSRGPEAVVDLFIDRVTEYRGRVMRCRSGDVAATIAAVLAELTAPRIAVPSAVASEWCPTTVEAVIADELSARELDEVDGAITGAALAIAVTGSIVLDGGAACGHRALSLVPDLHLCVVAETQVVETVPEAIRRLQSDGLRWPITIISGPSATSDIELQRVEGVHGPRRLVVILVTAAAAGPAPTAATAPP